MKYTPDGIWCKELPEGNDRQQYLKAAALRFDLSEMDYINISLNAYEVVQRDGGYLIQLP